MKVKNHRLFACTDYTSFTSTLYQLGDIVIKEREDGNPIGVILQVHDEFEFGTDMFGNCCDDEIRLATMEEIEKHRPDVVPELVKPVAKLVTVSLCTRVIVDENATDLEILEACKSNFVARVELELGENLESITDDTECPYGTFDTDK